MISNIDPVKSASLSIIGASVGTLNNYVATYVLNVSLDVVNTMFQHAAWTVAILAGCISAFNGIVTAVLRYRKESCQEILAGKFQTIRFILFAICVVSMAVFAFF